MPLYEFACRTCGLLEMFFARRASCAVPRCPHCGGELERMVSGFSTGPRGGRDDAEALGGSVVDPGRAAAAAEKLGAALDAAAARAGADPVAAARAVRKFSEATGVRFGRDASELLESVERGGDAELAGARFEEMVDSGTEFFGGGQTDGSAAKEEPGLRRDPVIHDMPEDAPPPPARRPGPWDADD